MPKRTVARLASRVVLSALAALSFEGSVARRAVAQPSAAVEAISLLGDSLRRWPIAAETKERYERQLVEARAAYERTPTDADSIVWLGRRLAYLGRVRDAIAVYSDGIALHPRNAWLYRHRGHRYITVREFDKAAADLEQAALLVTGLPDETEPDGQPNDRNLPIGTLKSNIDYHLALAHHLRGEFHRAIPIYERELSAATNDDRRVSIAYWYYLSLRRLGRDDEAAELLARVRTDVDVVENDTYRELLRVFKGEIAPEALVPADGAGEMSVADATAAYGVAAWHMVNGRREVAEGLFRRIIAGGQWPAFGYVAAEAELARWR